MRFTPPALPTLKVRGAADEAVLRRWLHHQGKVLERQLLGGLGGLGGLVGGAVGGTVEVVSDLTSNLGLPCLIPGVIGNCPVASPASTPVVVAPTSTPAVATSASPTSAPTSRSTPPILPPSSSSAVLPPTSTSTSPPTTSSIPRTLSSTSRGIATPPPASSTPPTATTSRGIATSISAAPVANPSPTTPSTSRATPPSTNLPSLTPSAPITTRPAAATTTPVVVVPSSSPPSQLSPSPPATSAPATPNNPSPTNSAATAPAATSQATTSQGAASSSNANGGSTPGTGASSTSIIAESQVVPIEPATTIVLSTVINGETVAFTTATLTGTSAIAVASSLLASDAIITTTDASGQTLTLSGSAASSILASSLSSFLSEAAVPTSAGFVTTTDSRGRTTTSFRSARPTSSGGPSVLGEQPDTTAADRTRSILIGVFVSIFVAGLLLAIFVLWGRKRRAKAEAEAASSCGSSVHSRAHLFPQFVTRPAPTFLGLPVSFNRSRTRNAAASIRSSASSSYSASIEDSESFESEFEIRSYHRTSSPFEIDPTTPPRPTSVLHYGIFDSLSTPTPATFLDWQRGPSSPSSGGGTVRPSLQRGDSDATCPVRSPYGEEALSTRSPNRPSGIIIPARPILPSRSPLRPPISLTIATRLEEAEPRSSSDGRSLTSFETAASRLGRGSSTSLDQSSEEEMDPMYPAAPRLRLDGLGQTGEDPFVERSQASGSGAAFVQRRPFIKPRADYVPERRQ